MMMLFYQRKQNFSSSLFILFLISWKIAGNIPGVELRLSDKRLFQIINHIQSIPFPESKQPFNETPSLEAEVCFFCFFFEN
jgi:hypothetical protein